MLRTESKYYFLLLIFATLIFSCSEDNSVVEDDGDLTDIPYDPQVYDIKVSPNFPVLEQPSDNIATIAGVDLGRHIFYDPILSRDSTISCSSCHLPNGSFTDNKPVSLGIEGAMTSRSSMSLLNVAFYNRGLFWDGRESSIESLSLIPVEDIHEMDNTWAEVVSRLKGHSTYPQ
ncbi:MAG: cytochrome C peroxidase, partial [Saprospiraceae bacterium]|nr:cytochrome C peroxidase [Saprospiraceae bacterium]